MIPPTMPILRDEKTGRYVLKFDASLYKVSNCRRKLYNTMFEGFSHGEKNHKIEYGTAFHKFLQLHYSGKSLEKSSAAGLLHYMDPTIQIPESDWRNVAHLANCMNQYVDYYRKEGELLVPAKTSDGSPMLECKFSYPYYRTDRVEVLLSGTIDFVGTFASNWRVFVDHKTTAMAYRPDEYLASYEMSPQLMLYKWVHDRLFGGNAAGMINGIFLVKTNKNTFKRSPVYEFTPTQMLNFERRLKTTVVETVTAFEWMVANDYTPDDIDKVFPPNYICCDEKYGMCEFVSACKQSSHEDAKSILESDFVKRYYDPLQFQT